ncbi:MAG: efflux transporter periplasmic adaptor subunit [Flavobacteriales bacterium]|nr:efflux transporter periplasmic adaptor subunit [Flavobacteriales bacterium]
MKKFLKILGVVVLIGVFVYTIYYLYAKSQEKPVVYKTEKPLKTDIIKKTVATGSVVPRKEIEIKPQVSGIIDEIYVEAGMKVEKGDKIALVKIIPNMVSLNNAENRLRQAKISLDNAKLDYDRNKELLDKKVIAQADFQQIEVNYRTAEEEYKAAQANLELVKKGETSKNKTQTNRLIRSTIAGMVLDVPVEEGNSVIEANTMNEGTTVASVADMTDLVFEGKVDESEVGKIKEGMNLIMRIGAIEDETFDAVLEYISPKGIEEDGAIQFEIKAAVKLREDQFIRAGYSANADIVLDRRDSVLAISEALLQFDGDSAYVEVQTEPQVFEKRYIETGLSDGINIEILSGIDKDTEMKLWNLTEPTMGGRGGR